MQGARLSRNATILWIAFGLIAFTAWLGAQAMKPVQGAPTGGSSSSGLPTTGQPTSFGSGNTPSTSNPGISGRLLPAPANRVPVELYQDGIRIDTTYSAPDGNFRFPRQQTDHRYEIRVTLEMGQVVRQEVDFQGNFPTVVHMNQMRSVKSANAEHQPATGTVSVANLLAPKKAQQEFDRGSELAEKKKYEEAIVHLQRAVKVYAKYPAAYNEIGQVERARDHRQEAEESFRKAIEADPKWTQPYINLARVQLLRNDFAGMMQTNEQALAVDPTLALAHFFNALGYFRMGRLEEAEKSALTAARSDQGATAEIQLLLARVYEARHDGPEALARYKEFLKQNPNATNAPQISARVAALEQAGGKP